MNFKFNGKLTSIDSKITIEEFIHSLNIDINSVIVLFNDNILKKEHLNTPIEEDCSIEVLNFVCGG